MTGATSTRAGATGLDEFLAEGRQPLFLDSLNARTLATLESLTASSTR
jgi:hypothetical protein